MNLFPYTNFHDLNLDWLLQQLRKAVFKVNGTEPDETGNVNLPGVSGVSSVNGVGADGSGNVQITAANVDAVPDSAMDTSVFSMTATSNLLPSSYISGLIRTHTAVINLVAVFANEITDYTTVGDLVKIPIFSTAGNLFNLPSNSLANAPLDMAHSIGPSNMTQRPDNITGLQLFAYYDGANTVIYALNPTLLSLPANGIIVDQFTKLL